MTRAKALQHALQAFRMGPTTVHPTRRLPPKSSYRLVVEFTLHVTTPARNSCADRLRLQDWRNGRNRRKRGGQDETSGASRVREARLHRVGDGTTVKPGVLTVDVGRSSH